MLLTRQGISLGHVIDFIRISSLEIKVILLTLHVAMQIGLYLHRIEFGVWHVVSEDSDHFRARLTVIHCLHDLNDLQQPTWSEVRIRSDDPHARIRPTPKCCCIVCRYSMLFAPCVTTN
jgi:hypothetical protein